MQQSNNRKNPQLVTALLLLIAGAGLLMYLNYIALRYTVINEFSVENIIIYDVPFHDSFKNALAALLVAIITVLCGIILKKSRIQPVTDTRNIILAISAIIYGLLLIIWINRLNMGTLRDDTGICYSIALNFKEGNYDAVLSKEGYLYNCPHQYGIVALNLLFFHISEGYVVEFFHYFNAILLVAAFITGTLICRRFESQSGMYLAEPVFILFTFLNIPISLYTNYMYGDVASFVSMTAGFYLLLKYNERGRASAGMAAALVTGLGVLLRENTVIFGIAASIALVLSGILKRRYKDFLIVLLIILFCTLPLKAFQTYYSVKTGIPASKGIPNSLYIAMGLEESDLGPGWFNSYNQRTFMELDSDYERADAEGKKAILKRLSEFEEKRAVAADFIERKLISQWAEPSYNSIFCCLYSASGDKKFVTWLNKLRRGEYTDILWKYLDAYQSVAYFGMLVFVLTAIIKLFKEGKSIENPDIICLIPIITLIGGFAFSLIWEAKSRYVIEYANLMIPLSCVGYAGLSNIYKKNIQRKEKRDDTQTMLA
ncbi:MAG: hypothetical protein IJ608_05795 [Lachnospiraceae bacterium]|nr:hypothetical protein [Lachnospiraceae bacterium]